MHQQQVILQRSDTRFVLPFEDESNEVYRYIIGNSDDETTDEEDLYEILMSKGRLPPHSSHKKEKHPVANTTAGTPTTDDHTISKSWKANNHNNSMASVTDDDLTASCTESYSWNGSFHDSFTSVVPGEESSSSSGQQTTTSSPPPALPAIPLSPRRRRRGSFTGIGIAPVSKDHHQLHQQETAADAPAASTASSSIQTKPRDRIIRQPRRKHGSFLDSSSTSFCLLSEIAEESTEASGTCLSSTDNDHDVNVVLGIEREDDSSKVRFGQVEIRYYNVTLDQCGGYGRDGKPVMCPLTLDWSYSEEVTRKPAVLYGYSSYFKHAKPKPLTLEERRARLGVLHHLRQPQVKHWEHRSLLYQMSSLSDAAKRSTTDRWDDLSTEGTDRIPSAPCLQRGSMDALDYELHDRKGERTSPMIFTWQRTGVKAPKFPSRPAGKTSRGVEMPVVPMQWIDHDARQPLDTWEPLPSVWIDVNSAREPNSDPTTTHLLDTKESLEEEPSDPISYRIPPVQCQWVKDQMTTCNHDRKVCKEDDVAHWDSHAPSQTDFRLVPFESILAAKCDSKLKKRLGDTVASLTQPPIIDAKRDPGKDWKRAPPCRSNFRVVPFDDVVAKSCLRVTAPQDAYDELEALQESFANVVDGAMDFLGKHPSHRSLNSAAERGDDEVQWERNLRSPSTFWWIRNRVKNSLKAESQSSNWKPETMLWLEEADKPSQKPGTSNKSARSNYQESNNDESHEYDKDRSVNCPESQSSIFLGKMKEYDDCDLSNYAEGSFSAESLLRTHPMFWLTKNASNEEIQGDSCR